MSGIAARLLEVEERIAAAALRSGRQPGDVRLVGVSKGFGAEVVAEAVRSGLRRLGENRAQELLAKLPEVEAAVRAADGAEPPEWHFVGRLQRNKVASLAPVVALWHSVDRPELVAAIARHAPGAHVLVQVELAGEPQKGGCRPEQAGALVELAVGSGLAVDGLMTVPPAGLDPRPWFSRLRALASALAVSELSMGMTDDFEIAVEEGATVVRVGRALFGPREPGSFQRG